MKTRLNLLPEKMDNSSRNRINTSDVNATSCVSFEGQRVSNGEMYYPHGHDVCQVCRCLNGRPELCATVRCGPPVCRAVKVKNRCCEWICLDDDDPMYTDVVRGGVNTGGNFITVNVNNYNNGGGGGRGGGGSADIGLRLVASSVTAILSLCLLFFLIYRLRRRRLRRCRARAAAIAAAAAAANGPSSTEGDSNSIDSSMGGRPPSDRWWKPPEFHDVRTAPPSYDAAVMYDAAEERVTYGNDDHDGDGGDDVEGAAGYSDVSSSSGSEAPAYNDIHGDPIISYPSSCSPAQQQQEQPQHRNVHLPRVLPAGPAPPASQLHHVPENQRPESRISRASSASDPSRPHTTVEETFSAQV